MLVELYAQSDIGRVRQGNEDNFLVLDLTTERGWTVTSGGSVPPDGLSRFELGERGLVLAVSDGMGGALAGDVASRMAVDTVREMLVEDDTKQAAAQAQPETPLVEAVRNATSYANLAIHRKSLDDARCSGMGATLTAAAVSGSQVELVQVGDSRAYVIRGDEIKLVTKDQSLVQQLVDVGQITEEEAETHMFRNVILQALGAQSDLAPALSRINIRRGDLLLLCSDGLSGKMNGDEMRDLIASADGDLAAACDALVREANERGGEDNITVVLARFGGEGLEAPDASGIAVEPVAGAGQFTYNTSDDDDTSPIP